VARTSSEPQPILDPGGRVDPLAIAAELAKAFAATAAARDIAGTSPVAERELIRQSDLLRLMVPQRFGGLGGDWVTCNRIVRIISAADSSLGHIFAWHHLEVVTPELIGTPSQAEQIYRNTAGQGWFWGSALNPQDTRVVATRTATGLSISGTKSFCTGAKGSDRLLVGAVEPGTSGLLAIILPTTRQGITVNDDWDNMGQRSSDSGSVTFDDVDVDDGEVLARLGAPPTYRTALRTCMSQLMLTNMLLGIADGALNDARRYTKEVTRPWPGSGVARAAEDAMVIHHYGELWIHLQAAIGLAERAAEELQECWQGLESLTREQVAHNTLTVSAAKVLATQVGLDVTSRTFEVMGARATSRKVDFDRYWRNLRTLTLHDPMEVRLRAVGNWYLNDQLPVPELES
jgi:alkylation response protein AidB-like acyl-CoA dehydrogenase